MDERVERFQEVGVYVEVRLGNLNRRNMTLIQITFLLQKSDFQES